MNTPKGVDKFSKHKIQWTNNHSENHLKKDMRRVFQSKILFGTHRHLFHKKVKKATSEFSLRFIINKKT